MLEASPAANAYQDGCPHMATSQAPPDDTAPGRHLSCAEAWPQEPGGVSTNAWSASREETLATISPVCVVMIQVVSSSMMS